MDGRLTGRYAIVTGAAAGIGLATARLFGRHGARLALIDLDGERAGQAAAELRQGGVEASAHRADVSDEADVGRAFADILAGFGGKLHVLVNNAGIAQFGGMEEIGADAFQRVMAVNVTGTFLCSRAALPALRREGGAIVNVASIAGLVGIARMPAYCASKAAVIGLTRQMAVDYAAAGVRVNCLCPGRIEGTDLDRWIRKLDSEETTAAKQAKYPLGRFGQPAEVADAALFLAADGAGFVTGTLLTVDGGMTAL